MAQPRNYNQPSGDPVDGMLPWALIFAVLAGVVAAVYVYHRGPINAGMMEVTRAELWVGQWVPFTNAALAHKVSREIAYANPARFTWDNIYAQLTFAGAYVRWIVLPLLLGLSALAWFKISSIERYRRAFTFKTLIQRNVSLFPCLAPVAWRDLEKEPLDTGPWRTPRQICQWAAEHDLVLDEKGKPLPYRWIINKDGLPNTLSPIFRKPADKAPRTAYRVRVGAIDALLVKQLGGAFSGDPRTLPPYYRALAAAFLAFGLGGAKVKVRREGLLRFGYKKVSWKERAQALLDQLSLSFREPVDDEPMVLDMSGADGLLEEALTAIDSEDERYESAVLMHTAFVIPYMMGLLTWAQGVGCLPSQQFIWLRPTDSTLFWALDQVGGRQPWVEATGPWSHFQCEKKLGATIEEPVIAPGTDGIIRGLIKEGWLPLEAQEQIRGE